MPRAFAYIVYVRIFVNYITESYYIIQCFNRLPFALAAKSAPIRLSFAKKIKKKFVHEIFTVKKTRKSH